MREGWGKDGVDQARMHHQSSYHDLVRFRPYLARADLIVTFNFTGALFDRKINRRRSLRGGIAHRYASVATPGKGLACRRLAKG